MGQRLTTTFERAHNCGACPSGYQRAAKAFGGIRKHGRTKETSMQACLRILDPGGMDWVLSRPVVWGDIDLFYKVMTRAHKLICLKDTLKGVRAGRSNYDYSHQLSYLKRTSSRDLMIRTRPVSWSYVNGTLRHVLISTKEGRAALRQALAEAGRNEL